MTNIQQPNPKGLDARRPARDRHKFSVTPAPAPPLAPAPRLFGAERRYARVELAPHGGAITKVGDFPMEC